MLALFKPSRLFVAFGELVLQEKKETREMKQRLMAIEEQLQRFQNEDHNEVCRTKRRNHLTHGSKISLLEIQ